MTPDGTAPSDPKPRRPPFPLIIGVGLLVLGAFGAVQGVPWPQTLGLLVVGVMVLITRVGKR